MAAKVNIVLCTVTLIQETKQNTKNQRNKNQTKNTKHVLRYQLLVQLVTPLECYYSPPPQSSHPIFAKASLPHNQLPKAKGVSQVH